MFDPFSVMLFLDFHGYTLANYDTYQSYQESSGKLLNGRTILDGWANQLVQFTGTGHGVN